MKEIIRSAKRAGAVVALAMLAVFAVPAIALADSGDVVAPVAVSGDSSVVTLTPMAWTIITGLILPFVIGLIMKASADSRFKAIAGIVVAAVAALVERATLADGSAVFSTGGLVDIGLVYIPQLATYLGIWQHFNLNQKLIPNKGLG